MFLVRVVIAIVLPLILSVPVSAAPSPATRPVDSAPTGAAPAVLAEIKVERELRLPQFISSLREKDPDLQIVIAGGRPELENLYVPPMHLKNVTIDQVLQLLQQTCRGLEVGQIAGQGPQTVYVLSLPQNDPVAGHSDGQLQVYALADAVERLAARSAKDPAKIDAGARRAALDAVLSLLKAAAGQADNNAPVPSVQVHEETQTLLVKGTGPQLEAVRTAIGALRQGGLRDQLVEQERKHLDDRNRDNDQINRLKEELTIAKAEAKDLREKLLQRDEEAAQLKAKLELLQAKYGPAIKG